MKHIFVIKLITLWDRALVATSTTCVSLTLNALPILHYICCFLLFYWGHGFFLSFLLFWFLYLMEDEGKTKKRITSKEDASACPCYDIKRGRLSIHFWTLSNLKERVRGWLTLKWVDEQSTSLFIHELKWSNALNYHQVS